MDLHVVGSVVFSVVAVVDSFAAEEHTKINLLMSKMAQRLWKHFGKALVFMCTLLVGVGSIRINGRPYTTYILRLSAPVRPGCLRRLVFRLDK